MAALSTSEEVRALVAQTGGGTGPGRGRELYDFIRRETTRLPRARLRPRRLDGLHRRGLGGQWLRPAHERRPRRRPRARAAGAASRGAGWPRSAGRADLRTGLVQLVPAAPDPGAGPRRRRLRAVAWTSASSTGRTGGSTTDWPSFWWTSCSGRAGGCSSTT